MVRLLGILGLVTVLYAVLITSDPAAYGSSNLVPLTRNQAFYAVITLGAAVVIITGGIDLSVGSVVALAAVVVAQLMRSCFLPLAAASIVLAMGLGIGLLNGLLITKLRLQSFLVTLCGLFVYRGKVVPVLDLHRLLDACECPPHLSSRIILVPLARPGDAGEELLLGLLAAQVADIRDVQPAGPTAVLPGLNAPGQPDLGLTLTSVNPVTLTAENLMSWPPPVGTVYVQPAEVGFAAFEGGPVVATLKPDQTVITALVSP